MKPSTRSKSRKAGSQDRRRSRSVLKHLGRKAGQPPGTLIYTGDVPSEDVRISVMDYSPDRLSEVTDARVRDVLPYRDTATVTWVNVDGLHKTDVIKTIGEYFNIHHLVQEDVVNTTQRPKLEIHDRYLFITLRLIHYDEESGEIRSSQSSFIIGENFLLSFNENEGHMFNPVRDRIREGLGRLRGGGTDYLAYGLVDLVVDNYFVIIEKLAEMIEEVEEELITDPQRETLHTIHTLKTDMIALRKSVWPLREVINRMLHNETPFIKDSTRPYLRDVYDHTIHASEIIETFRDIVSGMIDIYLSSVSNRLNEIMKVLTIIATLFMPLTFLCGWYGMNFKNMPELSSPWGYPAVIGVALLVAVGMLAYFRRLKWL